MPSTYVDRGIIKWNAFDALVGYSSMLEEMKYRLGKKDKPVLSDDDYEELNRSLVSAWKDHQEVELKYFHDGYVRTTYGIIDSLDFTQKEIRLSTYETFKAEDIIRLSIL